MNGKKILIFGLVILITVIAVVYFEHHKKSIYENLFIEFPKYYNQFLAFKYNGLILAIKPLEARASLIKKESDSKIVYLDAYPEVDVVQEKDKIRLKEQLILKRPGHPKEFKFLVKAEGLMAKKQDNGDLIFYKVLERLFVLPAPFMIDANGKNSGPEKVEMSFDPKKGLLIIKPSKKWLKQAKYPVILDPTVEISILNPHSHPQAGDIWQVEFKSKGKADLKITPQNQATIDDLDFISLKCGDEQRTPQILSKDVIFFPNWSCNKIGKISHLVKVAGNHTLKFQFGSQVAFAYNRAWYNTDWSYRKKITIDHTMVSESDSGIFNFPMLVNLASDSGLASDAQPDGGDIMFTSANGTNKIPHEIEKYETDGDLVAWVNVPSLSSTSDTYLYMYYGNSNAADQQNATGVWDSNYKGVWHLDETASASRTDSTSNANHGTPKYNVTATTDGKIGNANDFDGSDDYVDLGESQWDGSWMNHTITAWIKWEGKGPSTVDGLISKGSGSPNGFSYEIAQGPGGLGTVEFRMNTTGRQADTKITPNDGTWHFLAVTLDGSNIYFYLDGNADGSNTHSYADNNDWDMFIGAIDSSTPLLSPFRGTIDEVRISNTNRSAYWISNEYNNINSPDTFYTVGAEEESTTIVSWANVSWSHRKKITINSAVASESDSGIFNFPMMVNIASDSNLASDAQSNGNDIMFTTDNGLTKLDHEIEKYDSEGDLVAWVKVPWLSSVSDNYIYMYYGNSGVADQSNASAVWDSNFVMVQHLQETDIDGGSGDIKDSTAYANNGTTSGMDIDDQMGGQIDGSFDFDGSDDVIDYGDKESIQVAGGIITIAFWINVDAYPATYYALVGTHGYSHGYRVYIRSTGKVYLQVGKAGGGVSQMTDSPIGTGWHHIAVTYDPNLAYDNKKFYVDGVTDGTANLTDPILTSTAFLIGYSGGIPYLNGIIDEVRISNTNRSAYWISNEYNNMASPETFYTLGSEEDAPAVVRIKGGTRLKGGVRIK